MIGREVASPSRLPVDAQERGHHRACNRHSRRLTEAHDAALFIPQKAGEHRRCSEDELFALCFEERRRFISLRRSPTSMADCCRNVKTWPSRTGPISRSRKGKIGAPPRVQRA